MAARLIGWRATGRCDLLKSIGRALTPSVLWIVPRRFVVQVRAVGRVKA